MLMVATGIKLLMSAFSGSQPRHNRHGTPRAYDERLILPISVWSHRKVVCLKGCFVLTY